MIIIRFPSYLFDWIVHLIIKESHLAAPKFFRHYCSAFTGSFYMIRISQQQIARELGLSQALVSAALNGRKDQVAPETYEKIWSHAKKLGYRPRGMRTDLLPKESQPEGIGIILRSGLKIDNQNPYFTHVQNGLYDFLAQRGMHAAFLGNEDILDSQRIQWVKNVSGVALFGEVGEGFLRELKRLNPRVVSISASYPGWCHSVQANETQAARQIVEHLKRLGHRQIAWVGGLKGRQRFLQRRKAIEGAFSQVDGNLPAKYVLEMAEAGLKEGRDAGQWLVEIDSNQRPSAAICFNSLMARGLANQLLRHGLNIPEDIAIVSMDRTKICSEDYPNLTAGGADPEKIGSIAGELLLKCTGEERENYCDIIVASQLDIQASTDHKDGKE